MATSLPVSTTISYLMNQRRQTIIKGLSLAASASAAAVMEVFDGAIDQIATWTLMNNGTGYAVGDLVTLVAGETGGSASRAVFRVLVIDNLSASSSVSSSPSSSISSSPSSSPSSSISHSPSNSMSRSTSISSSISTSPSSSLSTSPSSSISSSPSPSASTSTSISSSPSPSASRSSSISSSPSSSISTSISSSPSVSASPSAGSGEITSIELITAGGGYTAGNTYATTSNGVGIGATIKVDTVNDSGAVSVGKLAALTSTHAQSSNEDGIVCKNGISVRISGTGALGHVTYE